MPMIAGINWIILLTTIAESSRSPRRYYWWPTFAKVFDGGAAEASRLGFLWNLDWGEPRMSLAPLNICRLFWKLRREPRRCQEETQITHLCKNFRQAVGRQSMPSKFPKIRILISFRVQIGPKHSINLAVHSQILELSPCFIPRQLCFNWTRQIEFLQRRTFLQSWAINSICALYPLPPHCCAHGSLRNVLRSPAFHLCWFSRCQILGDTRLAMGSIVWHSCSSICCLWYSDASIRQHLFAICTWNFL
jgi:hypothetical protein